MRQVGRNVVAVAYSLRGAIAASRDLHHCPRPKLAPLPVECSSVRGDGTIAAFRGIEKRQLASLSGSGATDGLPGHAPPRPQQRSECRSAYGLLWTDDYRYAPCPIERTRDD